VQGDALDVGENGVGFGDGGLFVAQRKEPAFASIFDAWSILC